MSNALCHGSVPAWCIVVDKQLTVLCFPTHNLREPKLHPCLLEYMQSVLTPIMYIPECLLLGMPYAVAAWGLSRPSSRAVTAQGAFWHLLFAAAVCTGWQVWHDILAAYQYFPNSHAQSAIRNQAFSLSSNMQCMSSQRYVTVLSAVHGLTRDSKAAAAAAVSPDAARNSANPFQAAS